MFTGFSMRNIGRNCFAAAALLIAFGATAKVEQRIIGGVESSNGDWPSMAAIAYAPDTVSSLYQRQFCGGNLIGEKWVLSAAHCFYRESGVSGNWVLMDASDIRVVLGVTDLSESAEELIVTNIIIRQGYDPADAGSPNDIALLELAQVSSHPTMPVTENYVSSGTTATVIGWGAKAYDTFRQESSDYPVKLNEVDVPVVSNSTCNSLQSYNGTIVDSMLCAGLEEGGKDSCAGDSGGPLMVEENGQYRQAGVVSFGAGCAVENYYGVYTRTSSFLSWIESYIGDATGSAEGMGGTGSGESGSSGDGNEASVDNSNSEQSSSDAGAVSIGLLTMLLTLAGFRQRRDRLQ